MRSGAYWGRRCSHPSPHARAQKPAGLAPRHLLPARWGLIIEERGWLIKVITTKGCHGKYAFHMKSSYFLNNIIKTQNISAKRKTIWIFGQHIFIPTSSKKQAKKCLALCCEQSKSSYSQTSVICLLSLMHPVLGILILVVSPPRASI